MELAARSNTDPLTPQLCWPCSRPGIDETVVRVTDSCQESPVTGFQGELFYAFRRRYPRLPLVPVSHCLVHETHRFLLFTKLKGIERGDDN